MSSKEKLTNHLYENYDITKQVASDIVDSTFDFIVGEVSQGQEFKVSGFGRFEAVERSSRNGYNPQTQEKMVIPAKTVPKFKPYKAFNESVQ